MVVKIFYDTETTGLDYKKHSIHNLAGYVEVDGKVVEEFDIYLAPHEKAQIDASALKVCGVTEEQIRAYPCYRIGKKQFTDIVAKYIERWDKKKKAYLIGFNNRGFDDNFLKMLFELCGDTFFFGWFFPDTQDALIFASHYLEDRRVNMPSFKLKRVAIELGIEVDKIQLHGAKYDAYLTRLVYRIATGIDLEI